MHELDPDYFKKSEEDPPDKDTFNLHSATDDFYFNPILYKQKSKTKLTKQQEWLSVFKNIHIAIAYSIKNNTDIDNPCILRLFSGLCKFGAVTPKIMDELVPKIEENIFRGDIPQILPLLVNITQCNNIRLKVIKEKLAFHISGLTDLLEKDFKNIDPDVNFEEVKNKQRKKVVQKIIKNKKLLPIALKLIVGNYLFDEEHLLIWNEWLLKALIVKNFKSLKNLTIAIIELHEIRAKVTS